MKTPDELIAHWTRRMDECAQEIERIEQLPEGKHTSHEEHDRWIEGWEEDRRICRDTISYLQAIGKAAKP